jgi:two-component system, OmpR family, alkaline phosphatase synthesis response regulator PhoP
MTKILIVDDEPDIVEFLKYNLEREQFKVIESYSGSEALLKMNEKPDLILLDIMMPDMSGFEVCRRIKAQDQYKNIPVIFLTALSQEKDEVKGLEVGGSDFIIKPISPPKLIARVKSNLRNTIRENTESEIAQKLVFENLIIDPESFKVFVNGKEKFFPKKEFQVLYLLASKPDKLFNRTEILQKIWGEDIMVIDRTIDVHIRKIREKLGIYSKCISTIKGVGYKFKGGNNNNNNNED